MEENNKNTMKDFVEKCLSSDKLLTNEDVSKAGEEITKQAEIDDPTK